MAINNDERILEMRKKIQEKKESIGKVKRFSPITNCILPILGQTLNINVLSKDDLVRTLVMLNSFRMSAKDLELLDALNHNGYNIEDWITDIKNKLDSISKKEEETKLKTMEKKLEKLLSDDKRTELEIDEIAEFLK